MKIHGTAKGGALSKKDFGVAFGAGAAPAVASVIFSMDADGASGYSVVHTETTELPVSGDTYYLGTNNNGYGGSMSSASPSWGSDSSGTWTTSGNSTYSDYHTGGSSWEWLEITKTFNVDAVERYVYLSKFPSGGRSSFNPVYCRPLFILNHIN